MTEQTRALAGFAGDDDDANGYARSVWWDADEQVLHVATHPNGVLRTQHFRLVAVEKRWIDVPESVDD